jgi:hypothetical protein
MGSTSNSVRLYGAWVLAASDRLLLPNPLPVNAKSFDLTQQQLTNPVGAGMIQTIDRGPNLWVASYETPPLLAYTDKDDLMQLLLDQLNGSGKSFMGFDPRRTKPRAYAGIPFISEPWTVISSGTSIAPCMLTTDPVKSTVQLGNLGTLSLYPGDYFSFRDANSVYLFRVMSDPVGAVPPYVSSGGALTVRVTPTPQATFNWIYPKVKLTRASAEMKVIGNFSKSDKVEDVGPSYKWTAAQFINQG